MANNTLDFSRVCKSLAHFRFYPTDVFCTADDVCEYIRVASRDFGYTCIIHFPDIFHMTNVDPGDDVQKWVFRNLVLEDRYVPLEKINLQSVVVDESDTSQFVKNIREAYKLDQSKAGMNDETTIVYLNDVLRQLKRFKATCENHTFGLAMTRSSYMVAHHAEGARCLFVRRDDSAATTQQPPSKLFNVDPIISIQHIFTALDSISDILPAFERALRDIVNHTVEIFKKNVRRNFPRFEEDFNNAALELHERECKYSNAEQTVMKYVETRAELIKTIHETDVKTREAQAALNRIASSDAIIHDHPTEEACRNSARAAEREEDIARKEYEKHTELRTAVLEQYARARQRYFSWMFRLDRVVFDSVMFMHAANRSLAEMSIEKK